jgi:hypothetical protein
MLVKLTTEAHSTRTPPLERRRFNARSRRVFFENGSGVGHAASLSAKRSGAICNARRNEAHHYRRGFDEDVHTLRIDRGKRELGNISK